MESQDHSIMATAEDATLAKRATVTAGYYQDPFLDAMADSATLTPRNRRTRYIQPIIKRGTHARVACVDRAIASFLSLHHHDTAVQIVVLGAGKDTTYFRQRAGRLLFQGSPSPKPVYWKEVDHSYLVQDKARVVQSTPLLSQLCPGLKAFPYGYSTTDKGFQLIEHDLRHDPADLLQKLCLDPNLPTLYLLECVSMYLPVSATQALLESMSQATEQAWMVLYEPILSNDPFGQMMEQNLVRAQVADHDCGLLQTRSLDSQLELLSQYFGCRAVGCDMWSAYETVLTPEQRATANKAEFSDEVEEWMLIMRHYCFVVGYGGSQCTLSVSTPDLMTKVGDGAVLGFTHGKCKVLEADATVSF